MRDLLFCLFVVLFVSGCVPFFGAKVSMYSVESSEKIVKRADKATAQKYLAWFKSELSKIGWKENMGCYDFNDSSTTVCFMTSFEPVKGYYSVVVLMRSRDNFRLASVELTKLIEKSKTLFRGVSVSEI